MKKFRNIAIGLLILFTVIIVFACTFYNINMQGVSKNSQLKEVVIEPGTIESIAITLKENNLIRNTTIFKVYTRLTGKVNLKAGIYNLSENMGVEKIVSLLEEGSNINPDEIAITFKEGINIRKIANLISENTNNSYEKVLSVVGNNEYIDSLIDKYWFLTEKIKDSNIYYPLEGYLYPNTYFYENKDVSVEDIFEKMLDEMDKKLSPYKTEIENNSFDVHELLTLASIVELEGKKKEDRAAIAGVFYNRLNDGWTLGSDVTTYYAAKIDDWSMLTTKELNDCSSKYNTRCSSYIGLPIGPIANPSIESIEAVLHPEKNDGYYFVSSCDGEIYITKTSTEHNNVISKLKREGNWCA